LGADGLEPESESFCDGHQPRGSVVGIQKYRRSADEDLRLAIHDDAEGRGHENNDRNFYGRYLASADAMGFALSLDAARDWRRETLVAKADAVDAGYQDGRGGHSEIVWNGSIASLVVPASPLYDSARSGTMSVDDEALAIWGGGARCTTESGAQR